MATTEFPNYYHSMDREYFKGEELAALGISAPPMEDQLAALKLRIRQGAIGVELGFTGVAKGNMQGRQTTPEMYGREERDAIRELAKINKVELSTHATLGIMGLAGLGEGGFSYAQAEQTLHEIERAIDFAADTARGGAVVVHTGEWIRPVSSAGKEFQGYPDEEKKGSIFLAKEDTGRFMTVNKEEIVWEPDATKVKKWEVNEKGRRVPVEFETDKTGKMMMVPKTFEQVVREEREWDSEHGANKWQGRPDEEVFVGRHFDMKIAEAEAYSKRWMLGSQEATTKLESLEKEKERLLNMSKEERLNEQREKAELNRIKFARAHGISLENAPMEQISDPLQNIEQGVMMYRRERDWQIDTAKSFAAQADELKRDTGLDLSKEKFLESPVVFKSLEAVGLKRSADTLARAALFAYQETKEKKLERPVFVSPEAWQPEHWGSHPREMKQLIEAGRERMVGMLENQGMNHEKAENTAKEHIKATFDIGHAFTWRKFFEPQKDETFEETDKRFNKWLIDNVRKLAEEGIIGHVHLSDNLGYYDEHLTPGMGKAPIKEFLEELKKAGVDVGKAIVEPAHQDIRALHGAMRSLGSPVYGMTRWADVEKSYFGRTQPPYFAIEPFVPVQREWQMSYFGIPFE